MHQRVADQAGVPLNTMSVRPAMRSMMLIISQWPFRGPVVGDPPSGKRISLLGLYSAFSIVGVYAATIRDVAASDPTVAVFLLGVVPVLGQLYWLVVVWANELSMLYPITLAITILVTALRFFQVKRILNRRQEVLNARNAKT